MTKQPFAVEEYHDEGLRRVPFEAVLEELAGDLYDCRTGDGKWVVFTPARMRQAGTLSIIVLGGDWETAGKHKKLAGRAYRAARGALCGLT